MYELSISLKGEETENDRGYSNRETLAQLTVEVEAERGWRIYQEALASAVQGDVQVVIRNQAMTL